MNVATPFLDEAVAAARTKLLELKAERRHLLVERAARDADPKAAALSPAERAKIERQLDHISVHEANVRRALRAAGVSVDA